ncbi:hypothetical protein G7Z17_g7889 [Cylindrodendrum hubeiense]|uniref:AAA+ ATPase domain-containing protein n=1 Tax=Cylindrodendrum hubeiense TaxID=595255 RepID=A0A9P5H4R5_9HYPO|nr:hypothetical protein G7Z17_g7889 [Cylindrodendrum hubeiense]
MQPDNMTDIYSLSSGCSELGTPSDDGQAQDRPGLKLNNPQSLSTALEAFKLDATSTIESTVIKQLIEVAENGSECDVQTLYEGKPECPCCKNWVEEYPGDLKTSIEQANENKKKALIVRMAKNHGDGNPLVLHSVVIQSQIIKDLLGEVFHGYNGITTSLEKLVFRSPFRPFYYRWKLFTEVFDRQKEKGHDAAPFAQLLYNIIELELRGTMAEIEDMQNNNVITYQNLWALFEPGTRVYSHSGGRDRFFLVESCEYTNYPRLEELLVQVKFIDWDGSKFGYASKTLRIREFSGTRAITDLPSYPAKFLPYKDQVEETVMARGKMFYGLSGFHYKAYSGIITYYQGPNKIERNVDGRMVVDASSFFYMNPQQAVKCIPLDAFQPWIKVADDDSCDVSIPSSPTDCRTFDDFIEGKGLGLTMLLVGNPGTGKTLTAEAIADKVRRPLYVLSASELGQEAAIVENRLQSALDFTRRWEAVLLLDECDVFLEKRSTNSLTHNEIVSVFLRMVEYYPGILFLTSNRPEAIDPAFQSRVHLTLHYPDLDAAARKHIWKQFVKSSTVETTLTDDQFTRLSMLPLNGRQIKNIVKISLLLVEGERTKLTTGHIQTVLRATNDIDDGKFEEWRSIN